MSETNKIQNEILLREIVEEVEHWSAKPRVFVIADFKDMETIVVQFDKFVGIMEMDQRSKTMVYIAFGRSPVGNLADGNIQLIDMRHTNDSDLWKRSNEAFMSLIDGKEPEYTQEIEGEWSSKTIITYIINTWQLSEEKSRYTIH